MVHRRNLALTATVLSLSVVLPSCGFPGQGEPEGSASGAAALDVDPAFESDWTGTITMFAQAYTPDAEVANSDELTALQAAADAYEAEHPGITIEFVDEKFETYTDTVRVKAAAGELYDVFWAQSGALNGALPRGIAQDLSPAFEVENPYVPDAATWAEAMNPQVIAATRDGRGASYNINGDYVITGWYYNRDLFAQAGITELPTTWSEFTAVCQQLQAAGVIPVAYVPYYGWMQRHFLTDLYAEDYETIAALDGSPGFSSSDEALATDQGVLSPDDPRFMSWWPAFKEATDTWQRDYVTAPSSANDRAEQDFVAGKAAMYYTGSWMPAKLEASAVPFAWDVFPFPSVTTDDTPYATGADTAGAVGGPNAAYQFAMATPQADRTMEEEGKPEAVLDWMRYLGTPEVAEPVVNEAGQFIPTFAGTAPVPALEESAEVVERPWQTIAVGGTGPGLDAELQTVFGSYLAGDLTLEEAGAEVDRLLSESATTFIAENDLG